MRKKKNSRGNVLINSFLVLIAASIILTTIIVATTNTLTLQNIIFKRNSAENDIDVATDILFLTIKEEMIEYLNSKTVVDEQDGYWLIDKFLKSSYHFKKNNDEECLFDPKDWNNSANDPIPITCTDLEGNETIYNIILTEIQPTLYDYAFATNGDIYFNGTSYVDGGIIADSIYLSNYTLNEFSAISPTTPIEITPLLDSSVITQNNYSYFYRDPNVVGTDIYAVGMYGNYSDVSNPGYVLSGSDILGSFTNLVSSGDISLENIRNYTHTENSYDEFDTNLPVIRIEELNSKLELPSFSINYEVNELLKTATGITRDFVSQIDQYTSSSYSVYDDLVCYTSLYGECDMLLDSNTSTVISTTTFNPTNHTVLADGDRVDNNHSVTLNTFVESFGSPNGSLVYIEGDLIIDGIDNQLSLIGDIIVTGDIIITGNITSLTLTGNLYTFGTLVVDNNSNLPGLNSLISDIGFIFVKENILFKDTTVAFPANRNTFSGYLYAEGSVLIDTTQYSGLLLYGGVYAEAETRNLNTTYPLKIGAYDFPFDGIMVNSYAGFIDGQSNYIHSLNAIDSRAFFSIHPDNDTIDGPIIFADDLGSIRVGLAIEEVTS